MSVWCMALSRGHAAPFSSVTASPDPATGAVGHGGPAHGLRCRLRGCENVRLDVCVRGHPHPRTLYWSPWSTICLAERVRLDQRCLTTAACEYVPGSTGTRHAVHRQRVERGGLAGGLIRSQTQNVPVPFAFALDVTSAVPTERLLVFTFCLVAASRPASAPGGKVRSSRNRGRRHRLPPAYRQRRQA